ncbi:RagB/SusD family nutrient uptake outer membrane protein [Sphingobacterium psychroaquaticum]|uniref:Starch-binding associating with outer membrane n=1 Tax=Sphingobacterium psychroaquaticum TaxID=561061 RepID=A0A1X7L039_9SPHI|nr:RagB/SusD family nutrient uptake outer membrane protein [Sphingobacterium psychroaquaticum]SMG46854.1 Starch-binding associating with outer membrane [Sphingobacterium psychroaquaticum]
MKLNKLTYIVAGLCLSLTSCDKFLDKPPLTTEQDETAWTTEDNVRLYANKFLPTFFVGYNVGTTATGAALTGFRFSDDVLALGNQENFTRSVPNSSIWDYTSIRSLNIMIDRIESRMGGVLSTEAKAHWLGIARFYRGWRYSQVVASFGDIPYYNQVLSDTDFDALFKPRTPRNEVMDAVYEDLKFALENVRLADGEQNVNRYIVAGIISRVALHEATWQKYYYNNGDQAKKFLELAVTAGDMVINSGRYDIVTEYRTLFSSEDLKGNKDCLLYRIYNEAGGVQHAVATNSNLRESTNNGPTTDLMKAFICNDGKVWQNSAVENSTAFDLDNMIKTRDPRFEATFHRKPLPANRASLVYIAKFLPRDVEAIHENLNSAPVTAFTANRNTTDYPVLRYAEVLLNWIEAKAELATMGGAAVSQADLDKSVNKIRLRPIAAEAVARGVKQTAALQLGSLPSDPERDITVSPLLWEIRRERRMEFTFEFSRIADLERWGKLEYMDTKLNPDLLSGGWVNFQAQLPNLINADLGVVSTTGTYLQYNGSNAAAMRGFFRHKSNNDRLPFVGQVNINPYLTPVGRNQMDEYVAKGYVLKQTEGWPQN